MSYPKWQYTTDKSKAIFGGLERPGFIGRVIKTAAEAEALGGVWYDTPTDLLEAEKLITLEAEKAALEAEIDDIDAIRAALDKKGIEYDKRWGIARLKGLLDG